jgi:hypothetical protein
VRCLRWRHPPPATRPNRHNRHNRHPPSAIRCRRRLPTIQYPNTNPHQFNLDSLRDTQSASHPDSDTMDFLAQRAELIDQITNVVGIRHGPGPIPHPTLSLAALWRLSGGSLAAL